jgi:hypothetical protein
MDLNSIAHLVGVGLSILALIIIGSIIIKVISPKRVGRKSWLDHIADRIREPLEYLNILHESEGNPVFGGNTMGSESIHNTTINNPLDPSLESIAGFIFTSQQIEPPKKAKEKPKKEEPEKKEKDPKQRFDDLVE